MLRVARGVRLAVRGGRRRAVGQGPLGSLKALLALGRKWNARAGAALACDCRVVFCQVAADLLGWLLNESASAGGSDAESSHAGLSNGIKPHLDFDLARARSCSRRLLLSRCRELEPIKVQGRALHLLSVCWRVVSGHTHTYTQNATRVCEHLSIEL